jgi:hypothetical protein
MLDNISSVKFRKVTFLIAIACMMAIFVSGFETMIAKSNDVKRRADIREIEKALDIYHDKHGVYPDSIEDWREWDLSFKYKDSSGFLEILKKEGILVNSVFDPINNANYHYRYAKYKAGDYECQKPYYILQITNFEVATEKNGKGFCPGFDFIEEAPNGYTVQGFD